MAGLKRAGVVMFLGLIHCCHRTQKSVTLGALLGQDVSFPNRSCVWKVPRTDASACSA